MMHRVEGETWREWTISWTKVYAIFVLVWFAAGLGWVLWKLGFRLPEDETGGSGECAP